MGERETEIAKRWARENNAPTKPFENPFALTEPSAGKAMPGSVGEFLQNPLKTIQGNATTAAGITPAPAKPSDGTEPPALPPTEPTTEFTDKMEREAIETELANTELFPTLQRGAGPRGPGNVAVDEYENANTVGGKPAFENVFKTGPKRVGDLQREIGKMESEAQAAMGQQLEKQSQDETVAAARIASRRADNDAEVAAQQEQLQQKTRMYTDDLANQNKFWQNPGNIVSAIAYSLMSVFSSDPAIGAKLINQAIDRDMANRKDLANMHLGELRSNVGTYRKIAEDKQTGDLLAQAESHRIAAQQIRAIGAKLQSPIALKNAELAAADQEQRYSLLGLQAYNQYLYNKRHLADPRLAAMEEKHRQGVPEGWSVAPGKPQAVQSVIPGVGMSTAAPAPQAGAGGGKSTLPASRVAALVANPDEAYRQALRGQLKGPDLRRVVGQRILFEARNQAGDPRAPGFDDKAIKIENEMNKEAVAAAGKIAEKVLPNKIGMSVTSAIQHDLRAIRTATAAAGEDPDEFIGSLRRLTGPALSARINDMRIRFGSDKTAADRLAKETLEASERFHQLLAGETVEFYHGMAGAAQNATETANLKQVIDGGARFSHIENHVRNRSNQYGSSMQEAMRSSGNRFAPLIYLASYGQGGQVSLNDPGTLTRTPETKVGK